MNASRSFHEPDYDEGLHPEGPSASDLDRFGDEFRTCANCGRQFYDQAELCPHCGHAISGEARGMPRWAMFTLAVVLVAFVLYLVF